MKPCELQSMLSQAVAEVGRNKCWQLPPEAKLITGVPRNDAQLHHVLVEYGVEVELNKYNDIKDYRVVDEKKFMMFILRWS